MNDYSPKSSRRSSIESMDFETDYQTDHNRQISQESQADIENRFISQICQSLSLDEMDNESRIIAKQLLINGRQELLKHRDDIRSVDFENQMDNNGNSTLLDILKRYFEQQWQQNPLDWFKKFITDQQSLDNDKHYRQVLTRTAEYGQKYMKECSVFSVVLQLVFVFNDDIDKDDSIFNQIWNTFIIDGCKIALKKWKKYIISVMMKKYIDSSDSPLFLALREYFLEPVLSLFSQSGISDERNLFDTTLECLANDGWAGGLNDARVIKLILPKKYKLLMTNFKNYLEEKGLSLPVVDTSPISSPVLKNPVKELSTHDNNVQPPLNDPIIVYIPDLPLQIVDNHKLEEMIRQCLKRKHKQEIVDIKFSNYLGIGKVYLQNNNEKEHLIHVLKSIILDTEEEENIIIKFTSDLELISYVVIQSTNDENLPSFNEVAQRWIEFYKDSRPPLCEQLSIQFPNIYRVVSHSLDELIKAMAKKEFPINGQNATVYFRADCCFLEDLPRNTSVDQLRQAITKQLTHENISTGSIYIQHNQTTTNAVILTSFRARKWALFDSIKLDGRVIMKKTTLTYRLVVRPIPKNFPISLIEKHWIFENTVEKVFHRDDRLIVELSDKTIYEKCINQGALRAENHLLHIEIDSEDDEINAKNWYETEMYNHKPNIMPFIRDPQHSIFRWKWSPQAFQEQFQRCMTKDHKHEPDHRGLDNNQKRHLLRVTVMLNTIGVVWKGSYRVAEREIKITDHRLKTIVYDHRSKLQLGTTMPLLEANKLPYPSTLIKVVDEDCLYVYQRLVAQNCCPLLLNMANADSPGGGYRVGDGAQEETLFRRSNYFRSLDIDLDNEKPTSRFYCNSNCELEILSERQGMYPMDEFSAIYTAGLTVFRQAEDTGYDFMDEPLSDVCAIAMAAYRNPNAENNRLAPKFSIGMRKKIENIFAIAYHHKHDCLILSALGCGAFRNPPEHVAAIFKSVAEQYAGFFKSIYFAIVDDHNTGLQFNPQGNYRPFKKLLDNMEVKPKEHKLQDMMIGPWRILNMPTLQKVTLSDIRISYLIPCYHGGRCDDIVNDQHCRDYAHPPLCPLTGSGTPCKLSNDEDHTLWFIHLFKCPYGGECSLVLDDAKHANQFEHPQYCREGGHCNNMNLQHLQAFRHVPICKHGIECWDFNRGNNSHCREYRHCREVCPQAPLSARFHDPQHILNSVALNDNRLNFVDKPTKLDPCRASINCLRQEDADHMKKYSHPCQYAELCRQKHKEPHLTHETYVVGPCSIGKLCSKLDDPVHRAKYRHIDMPDFLIPCRYQQQCHDRSNEHRIKYSHGEYIEISPKRASAVPPHHQQTSDHGQKSELIPCRDGLQCHKTHDAHHCSKYSHPVKQHPRSGGSSHPSKNPCKYGALCRNIKDPLHRSEFSHLD